MTGHNFRTVRLVRDMEARGPVPKCRLRQNGYIGARGGGRRNLVHIYIRPVRPIEGKKCVYHSSRAVLLLESISHLISFEKLGGFGGGASTRIARP